MVDILFKPLKSGNEIAVGSLVQFNKGDRIGLFIDRPSTTGFFSKNGFDMENYVIPRFPDIPGNIS